MGIENLGQGKEIKVQEIETKVDSNKSELGFDCERDIKEADWAEMKKYLETQAHAQDWSDYAQMAFKMKILFPEREDEIWLSEEVKEDCQKYLLEKIPEMFKNKNSWGVCLSYLAEYRILFKDLKESDSAVWTYQKAISNWLTDVCVENQDHINKAIFFELIDEKIAFPGGQRTSNQRVMEEYLGYFNHTLHEREFAAALVYYKITTPVPVVNKILTEPEEYIKENDPWEYLQDGLRNYRREEDINNFASLAFLMKMIQAQKIFFENGIEMTMPGQEEEFAEQVTEMPVERRY